MPAAEPPIALAVRDLRHRFGAREVLHGVSFDAREGELFGFLGPNGSGKSTIFRILSTQLPAAEGAVSWSGGKSADLRSLRAALGVVFQSPALDGLLTARENLRHHGLLYGLRPGEIERRCAILLERFGLRERADEPTSRLSGGMRRKTELAKALLTEPEVLILDEPSTGLDPLARAEFLSLLKSLQRERTLTVLLTTHLLDEAAECDRLAILDQGNIVALDAPGALKSRMAGEVVGLRAGDPESVREELRPFVSGRIWSISDEVFFEHPRAHEIVPRLAEIFGDRLASLTLHKPTLEDVFVALTGHRFDAPAGEEAAADRKAGE